MRSHRNSQSIKTLLRRVYTTVLGWTIRPASRASLHDFWKDPDHGQNRPEDYLGAPKARGHFVAELIEMHSSVNNGILEIGCHVGRNLNSLYTAGYTGLYGIEISENAVSAMRKAYPEMAAQATIYNAPVEDVIKQLADKQFNVVFTMAVLEHIHPDSEWIFADMARITNQLVITVENESRSSWRQFPRDYREIFESLGLRQVSEILCEPFSSELQFTIPYVARVFRRVM